MHSNPTQLDPLVLQQLGQQFDDGLGFTHNCIGDGLGEWVESGTYRTCSTCDTKDQKCDGGYEDGVPAHAC